MSIVDENLEILLKGGRLVKEIFPQCNGLHSWLEISINSENIGPYPLRVPPSAMLQGSPYLPKMAIESAIFRLRKSSFAAEDIAMGFDPSYDSVGKYQHHQSFDELCLALQAENVHFEDFVKDTADSDYPL